jgi:M6 family metalloprotease-like protein
MEIDPAQFRIFDLPNDRFTDLTGLDPGIQAPLRPLGQMKSSAAASGKVLTILVQWENHPAFEFFHPREVYDSLLYSTGVYPTGSVADYYNEVSYGAFHVTGQAVGWLSMTSSYNGWYDINEIIRAADPLVNFADYDANHDGKVDALWIIHAGPGQEETHDLNDIWSHAILGADVPTHDGVHVDRWSVVPEENMDNSIITIRVFCHEYGHILGLPDLYDYDGKLDTLTYSTPNDANDHPVNDWDVMGYAGYNLMSYGNRSCPSHFCAWSRAFLGWVTPVVPTCLQGSYDLYNIEEYSSQNVYKVPINAAGSEYFLLEYRNPHSSAKFDHVNSDFSAYCPWFTPGCDTLDQGLIVTHIDDNSQPNDGWPHYGVAVVDAGYNPAHPWNGQEFTEWWYPYEFQIGAAYSPDDPGQTTLSASTSPNSNGYDGPSGVVIQVVSQTSDHLSLIINKSLPPILDPIAPISIQVGDSFGVWVHAIDPNCTAPGLSPGSLPSYAHLADSTGGRGALNLNPGPSDVGIDTAVVMATDGYNLDTIYVQITVTPPPCACDCHADPAVCDATQDVLDVVGTINIAFRGAPAIPDPNIACPYQTTDVDCSGDTGVIDVVKMINVAFRGMNAQTEFCRPCL